MTEPTDDQILNAQAALCQATFDLLELEELHLTTCPTATCELCPAIRRTREALEALNLLD